MSDVIDPGAIPIPTPRPEALEAAAQDIKTDGENIAQTGHDIVAGWQSLSQFYHAPEANLLFAKINPVAADGDSLKSPTSTVCDALTTFAETAKSLVADLNGLRSEASAFRQKIAGDDDWRKDEDKVNEHNDLNNDILAKLVAYQAAERECANKITSLFGGTHFIGTDPTKNEQLIHKGEQVYGLDKPVSDVETPWAKPQKYDAPWYEDAWNGIKDFGVGLAQDLSSLVGMYGEKGWGWQGWGGLGENWATLGEGIAGLAGFYGPNGWGWQGWGNLGHNWLNLVNAFVPYQEWDGGRGAGYVITQGILNIASCFVGAGVVKGVFKGISATRGAEFAEATGAASKAGVLGHAFTDGFKNAFKMPRISDLKASLDNIKLKFDDLRGLNKTLDDAGHLNTDLPDTNLPDHENIPDPNAPDHEPAHVGGSDHSNGAGTDHGATDHGGTEHGGNDPGGTDHGGTDHGGTDHGGTDGNTDRNANDGNNGAPTDSDGRHIPGDSQTPGVQAHDELTSTERNRLDQHRDGLAANDPQRYSDYQKDPDHLRRDGTYDIDDNARAEAKTGLDLRERGYLPSDLQRPPGRGQGDFYSPSTREHYDIKEVTSSSHFNISNFERKLEDQFTRGRIPVIDTRNTTQATVDQIKSMIMHRGWDNDVIWYP